MGETTGIPWAQSTWNPWVGCTPVSRGCNHCYMAREMRRWRRDPSIVVRTTPATFRSPLKWSPRRIFTCSWSDFFHAAADDWRADAWDVIRQTPYHRYLILTKRPEYVADCLPADWEAGRFAHVWLGVTVEHLDYRERPRVLRQAVGYTRPIFISAEPMLSRLDLRGTFNLQGDPGVQWVICGGETGPGARHPKAEWVHELAEWCAWRRVPYFFKRWGDYRDRDGHERADWERREVPEALRVGEG